MKKFTKMMLSAYPKIPHLLKSMDEVIEESAVRSFYDRSASAKQAEKLLYRLNKRDSLAQIYGMMERAIGQLSDSERVVLSDRLTGACRAYKKERYSFSRTTYYRKLRRAVKKMEAFLYENDVENIFRGARLDRTAYFRFLEDAIVDAAANKNAAAAHKPAEPQKKPAVKEEEQIPVVKWKLTPLPLVDAETRR